MKLTQLLPEIQFRLEGEFLGFIAKSGGELKYIQVAVGKRILPIKLAKELRNTLGRELEVGDRFAPRLHGDRISVLVTQTIKDRYGKIKLTAEQVTIVSSSTDTIPVQSLPQSLACPKKGKILLCHKSSCLKLSF
jgi:hypothetical protein